ncbi:MAG: helix-turn-helix transcriptional regulator [Clostridia bacterium]|nr:helix-turn-helix transcriptional regulator [Clostridia bacterium]
MADNEIKGGMMRGHIDTIILLSLVDGDKDSNDIRDAIEEKSDNKYSVKQGTFYSAMQRLVKQNYIREYRSSAVDGIRRKYYSLTAKGKSSLDKNREEWNKSKELIDNLIETPSEQPKVQENKPTTIADEFDAFKQFADKNAPDFEFSSPDASDDYIDRLGEEVLNDLNDELNSLAEENAERTQNSDAEHSDYDNVDAEKDEKTEEPEVPEVTEIPEKTTEITDELITDADDEIPTEYDNFDEFKEDSYSYDFELPEEEPEEESADEAEEETSEEIELTPKAEEVYPEQEILEEPENAVEETPVEVTENIEEEQVYESENIVKSSKNTEETTIIPTEKTIEVVEEVKLEKTEEANDDMLYVEEGKPTNSRDYKSLLGRLFPKDEEKKPENAYAEKQMNFDDYDEKTAETEESDEETYYSEADDNNEKIEESNDDMLYVEEGKPTNSRDYKSLLGRLFPKDEEKKPENAYAEKQMNFDDYDEKTVETEEFDEETYYSEADDNNEKIVSREKTDDKYDYPDIEKTPRVERTSNGDYDFSDLYALAKKEGFKVRTSFSTNKNNDGNILINKLNFHAALLLYAILFVEMAVLNFSLSGLLGWRDTAKAIVASSLALYTVVTLIMYAISPKRKVKEITSFKDAIEVSLIIVFQLVIIILCVALFCEVDFNNVKEVLSFIVLPFILCINLPLFPILKYSLLGSGKYFDK